MGNELSLHLDRAKKTGVLALPGAKLEKIPEPCLLLVNLRVLDLSNNKLTVLHEAIGNLIHLKQLFVQQNRLRELPETIGALVKLETLKCSSNRLVKLPDAFANLKSLKTAVFATNLLAAFPTPLLELPKVESLDLSDNPIKTLPEDFKLLNLGELIVSHCQISVLSHSLSTMTKLRALNADDNCIELANISPTLLKDTQINNLSLERNPLDLDQLRKLDGWEQYAGRITNAKKKIETY